MGLCKDPTDEFISEKLRWVVKLSNGESIYQDDDRPDELERSAWIRLKEYVSREELSITEFYIQFISHIEEAAPKNSLGYYFVQAVDAVAFSGEPNHTFRYYIVGYLDDSGKIHCKKWMVPEIIQVSSDVREVIENDPKLIMGCTRPDKEK